MSEEQDRDQKDRDEGRSCGFVEEQERPAPPMEAPKQDVTQQFFQDCHRKGTLIRTKSKITKKNSIEGIF